MRTTIEPPGHQFGELVRVPDTTDISLLLLTVLALRLFTKGRYLQTLVRGKAAK